MEPPHHHPLKPKQFDSDVQPVYQPGFYVDISTDADFEFFRHFKRRGISIKQAASRARNEIKAILNTVEVLYANQIGLKFRIGRQRVDSRNQRPYKVTSADQLLLGFQAYVNQSRLLGAADLYHLFSGKSFSSGIVGLAYIGTVCRGADQYSYGISSKSQRSVRALVTAHELAHNFSATHFDTPQSVMSPRLSPSHGSFEPFSLEEIASHINQYGTCLARAPQA